ncbi:hypothetical protein CWS20_04580 [Cytobacillus horneckiae]|uniref:YtkA-like domain-containing protein n=1 Tax=Cytobacillus horneckiae TaxID=549687 RepID=A0A2N0ZL76_9BACI|nr:hypothetical protein CWS20_04580 [Cytobacillus horneckiae]
MILKRLIFLLVGALLLAGCNVQENDPVGNQPERVDGAIILPDKAEPEDTVELKTVVTQGEEQVADAEEVKFAVWKMGSEEEAIELKAVHEQDGMYAAATEFNEEGIYFVQAKIDAREQHVRPLMQFIVGELTEEEIQEFMNSKQKEEKNDAEEGHEHHHH